MITIEVIYPNESVLADDKMSERPQPRTVYANGFTAGPHFTSCRARVVEYENGNQVIQLQRTAREPKNFSIPIAELPDWIKEFQRILKTCPVKEE